MSDTYPMGYGCKRTGHDKRKGRPEIPRALSGHASGATFKLGVHKRDGPLDGGVYSQIAGI